MFGMIGCILGKQTGVVVTVVAAIMWVINRVIREALDSLRVLRALKADPPEPPTT